MKCLGTISRFLLCSSIVTGVDVQAKPSTYYNDDKVNNSNRAHESKISREEGVKFESNHLIIDEQLDGKATNHQNPDLLRKKRNLQETASAPPGVDPTPPPPTAATAAPVPAATTTLPVPAATTAGPDTVLAAPAPVPVATTASSTPDVVTSTPAPMATTTPAPAPPGSTRTISDNGNDIFNPGRRFLIKSTYNNRCVNVPRSETTGNPVLRMFTCHGRTNQQWEMDSLGHIHSALDYNKCIGLPGPSTRPRTVPGTKLQLYDCSPGEITQLWYWNANGQKLKSQWRQKRCLSVVAGHGNGSAARVDQCTRGLSTQWWEASITESLLMTTPNPVGTPAPVATSSPVATSAPVATRAPVATPTPTPTINPPPVSASVTSPPATAHTISDNGSAIYNPAGQYVIKSTFNDLCVNIPQSQVIGDPVLRMFHCHGLNNQKWQMDDLGHIHSALDYTKCIGLPGPSTLAETPPGTKLRLYTCNPGDITQLWYWNANGKKIKSQWRSNLCLGVVANQGTGSALRADQCGRGFSTQWWTPQE